MKPWLPALASLLLTPRYAAGLDFGETDDPVAQHVPEGYSLSWQDTFDTFDPKNWSRGLECDNSSATLIWNPKTGGKGLLNDSCCSCIADNDATIESGMLVLRSQKRNVQGRSPAKEFYYTSGWINSMSRKFCCLRA